jgi:hypothetical protein
MDKHQVIDYTEKAWQEASSDMNGTEKRRGSVARDNVTEHELTFMDVLKHHKMLIWWSFYFAMCAIGWCVQDLHVYYEYYANMMGKGFRCASERCNDRRPVLPSRLRICERRRLHSSSQVAGRVQQH